MIIKHDPPQHRGTIEVYPEIVPPGHVSIAGPWRWRSVSKNGAKLAYGEGFRRRAGALHSIDAQYSLRLATTTAAEVGEVFTQAALDQPEPIETLFVLPWRLFVFKRNRIDAAYAVVDYVAAVY
ncbi:hypothetical protein SEA_CHADMASTERC_66 [Gordonia phage ChadMasterC]|nr:hypothetical protein SEA_CHADMASTERC_66 [Gordonia phage ChadMasterC]